MRIQLKLVLDAAPDTVWELLRMPSSLSEVSHPFLSLEPLSPRGLPRRWGEGSHPVRIRGLYGLIPLGDQNIDVHIIERDQVRILEDDGGPTSGVLSLVTSWRHRMAVSPLPDGSTLYRDRLDVSAGLLTPIVWLGLWAFWQWRARGLRRLASLRSQA
ncbi:MAG TPA: hypothetical protein VNT53_00325 [Pseudolysinimonas sp.]|nr:hypothetical protein [Pseudolysinimonas sp.]